MQTRLKREEEKLRFKRKKSLANALQAFSESIDDMDNTLKIWLQQMELMKRIINDKLKKL